jgi:hypothetical protein
MLRYLRSHALAFTGENIDMFFNIRVVPLIPFGWGGFALAWGYMGWERGNYRFAHHKLGGVLLDGFVG